MLDALLKQFERKKVLAYARARIPQNYIGQTLFTVKTVNELTFEYWKSLHLLPVMASIQAFGAEAQIAGRDGATKVSGEIPPIKRKIPLGERYLLALKRAGAGDNEMVSQEIFNDIDNMIAAVFARIEKMRMDAIAYGGLTLDENGFVMNVDYGVPAELKITLVNANQADGFWSYANAEPITQLIAWVNAVVDSSGIKPTRALTSNTVVANLLKNAQVRTMIYGDQGGTRAVSLEQLNALMEQLELPRIATHDEKVRVQAEDGTITTIRFYPSNKITLLPPTALGETLMGPTAEALLDTAVEARDAAGIYARVDALDEPPAVWTKAAALSIPTFPMADAVCIAQVLA